MRALTDYAEFISENVQKFHNLIGDYNNNDKEQLRKEVEAFASELYKLAGESIEINFNIINDSNMKPETVVALFMQASELWHMFCTKYEMMYPNDPQYFNENAILLTFESSYKKGWLFKNEATE